MLTLKIMTQLRRELWENKTGFLVLPAILALVVTLFASYTLINQEPVQIDGHYSFQLNGHTFDNGAASGPGNFSAGDDQQAVESGELNGSVGQSVMNVAAGEGKFPPNFFEMIMHIFQGALSFVLVLSFAIVILIYAHATLFDDRKNREILFWRSMPVSETMNVVVKVSMIILIAPLVVLVLSFVSSIIVLVIGWFMVAEPGQLWPAIQSLSFGFKIFAGTLIFLGGLLPLIGWMLFASAVARRSPMLVGGLLPLGLVVDAALNKYQGINLHIREVFHAYGEFLHELLGAYDGVVAVNNPQAYLLAIIVGIVLLVVAVWLRNNRYEI